MWIDNQHYQKIKIVMLQLVENAPNQFKGINCEQIQQQLYQFSKR